MNFVRDRARAWDNTKFELDQLRRWLKKQMSWSLIFPASVWPWKKSSDLEKVKVWTWKKVSHQNWYNPVTQWRLLTCKAG